MAGSVLLTYTAFGTGGLSPAIAGVSGAPFWWIDTSGTRPASAVTSYAFDPFPAFVQVVDTLGAGDGGSLLLSSPFDLDADATLEVRVKLLKKFFSFSNSDRTAPLGFALLLRAALPPIVLANVTVENRTSFNNTGFLTTVPASQTPFVPTSPGVTATTASGNGLDLTLNGVHYAMDPNVTGLCGCFLDVVSTYKPGAGTYQLLFGVYEFTNEGTSSIPDLFRGALAVADVRTVC